MRLLVGLVVSCLSIATVPAFARSKAAEKTHNKAVKLFELGKYKEAAKLFADELAALDKGDMRGPVEADVRERLVLSLFSAGDKLRAKAEYDTLKTRFASFRFDPDRVFPDAIAFFETKEEPAKPPEGQAKGELQKPEPQKPEPRIETPPEPQKPEPATQELVVKPELKPSPESPREITTAPPVAAKKTWHWYYLAPLGIGQYLAGSPVRGTIILVLEAAFVAMNIAGYVLLAKERGPHGGVYSVQRAETARIVMNIGFFGVIGTALFGIIDGAALE